MCACCVTGVYEDGFNVYLEEGVVFGTVYGGIIFPPARAIYFPAPIVQV